MGPPFPMVELASRDALRRAMPDRAAYDGRLPPDGASSVYAHTPDVGSQARMFTCRMTEDPATGSATAALAALLAGFRGEADLRLRVGQGVDMGRPSLLLARAGGTAQ